MAKFLSFCLCIPALCILLTYGKNLKPNDQELIDSLQQYEFIEPKLSEPFTVQDTRHQQLEEKRFLSFHLHGHFIRILLTVNRNLLSPNFFVRHVTEHGYEIMNEVPRNCFFHGHVVGQEDTSIASISSCDGIEGYFTSNNTSFFIQPVEALNGEVFHIVFERQNLSEYEDSFVCSGHIENTNVHVLVENTPEAKHRTRRDVLSETKYVELVMVNDVSQYKKHGDKTPTRAIAAANHADSTYRAQNIRVLLVMIEIWKGMDQIKNSTINSKFLSNFIDYKQNILDKNETTQSDHAMLITQLKLGGGRQGWAHIKTICTPTSASLVSDMYSDVSIYGSIMAHELGHSFGFHHIDSTKETVILVEANKLEDTNYYILRTILAKCPCGSANEKKCLMNAVVTYSPLKWSNCTIAALRNTLEDDRGTCLFNLPKNHYMPAACGNGLIDEGEECDCGTKKDCEQRGSRCCNYTTCQLYPGKECDSGPCCQDCKIKSKGSLCREKVNDCDLPEFCDGKSSICAAADSYVHDGRTCHVGQEKSLCYLGVCHSYSKQCMEYWGEDAFHSVFCSKNLNHRDNNAYGFCKLLDDKTYMACKKGDVLCGKLQCEIKGNVNQRTPLKGGAARKATFSSNVCWSGVLNLDNVDDGMVRTGAMCAENRVCHNNTCLPVSEVFNQNECPNNCSGNGICNQHGHCHCNPGYGCPNCSEKCDSEGGSIDSANDCYCPGPTTTSMTTEVTEPTEQTTTNEKPNTTTEPVATSRTTTETFATNRTTTEPFATSRTTTEPLMTNRSSIGNKEQTKKESKVVKIVVPVVLVAIAIIIGVICIICRKQILERIRNSRPSTLAKTKAENYHVSYCNSRENLAKTTTPQTRRENPEFTAISFMPESKIDSKSATNGNSTTA